MSPKSKVQSPEFKVPSSKFQVQVSKSYRSILLILLTIYCCSSIVLVAQTNQLKKACRFDRVQMQFAGTPVEQARCLLRPVGIQGALGKPHKKLPELFEKLIGQAVKIDKTRLRKFLKAKQIDETTLGGLLDAELSTAKLPSDKIVRAIYFVIHDTSAPYYGDAPFPSNINDQNWAGNNLEKWLALPVAHVFVNRAGESITTTDFSQSVKKGWGTKFARDVLKTDGKGLQLHVELVQPRRRHPLREPRLTNDAIAPQPGFTEKQYERLALLYLSASVRRGEWLIPAFHAAVDAGIKDAHDDPQNFDLKMWTEKLAQLIQQF